METQRRWVAWVGLVLCLWSGFGVAAQGTFIAKNSGSVSPVLAVDGYKLSKVVGRVEIVYKGIVLNTAKNTFAADGIFYLGVLIVPDVQPGGTATITIRVWDSSMAATYADAVANWYGFESSTFDVQNLGGGLLPPSGLHNFTALRLGRDWCANSDRYVAVQEGTSEELPFYDQGFSDGRPAASLASVYTRTGRPPSGTFSGTLPNLIYRPAAHSYARDSFSYPSGTGAVYCLIPVSVSVIPALERFGPALVAEVTGEKVVPKLRGLDGRRYRIEKSADLTAWALAGEVTGNFSEVDLSAFLAPNDRAQFFRAAEITGP